MATYNIQVRDTGSWRNIYAQHRVTYGGYNPALSFTLPDSAITCVNAMRADGDNVSRSWAKSRLRIINNDTGEVVWGDDSQDVTLYHIEIQHTGVDTWHEIVSCYRKYNEAFKSLYAATARANEWLKQFNNITADLRIVNQNGEVMWTSEKRKTTEGGNTEVDKYRYWEIQIWDTAKERWRKPKEDEAKCHVRQGYAHAPWTNYYTPTDRLQFIESVEEFHRNNPQFDVRLIRTNELNSQDGDLVWYHEPVWPSDNHTGDDTTMNPDLNKPLTIPRTTVLKRIKDNLDTEVKKREDAEAKQAADRKAVLDVIAKFTPDELYNLFANRYTVEEKSLTDVLEAKTWVTKEVAKTPHESELEKFHRVLAMATDETIEITPDQELYKLL